MRRDDAEKGGVLLSSSLDPGKTGGGREGISARAGGVYGGVERGRARFHDICG